MGKRPIHSRVTNVLSESFIAIDLLTQETLAQSADEATGTTGRLLGTRDGYDDETMKRYRAPRKCQRLQVTELKGGGPGGLGQVCDASSPPCGHLTN